MTVLYIDSLFLLNLILDYLLLLGTGKLAGEPLRRPRLGLASLLGSLYAVAVCLWPELFGLVAWKLGVAVVMVWLAYGGARIPRLILLFFGLSAALGGGILALSYLGSTGFSLHQGVVVTSIDLPTLLLFSLLAYGVVSVVFRHLARHSSREIVTAVLHLEGRRLALQLLMDTGNTLTDPATGRPVIVVEGERLIPLITTEPPLDARHLADPATTLSRLSEGEHGKRFRLIPFRAVGVDSGLLLALRLDDVTIERQSLGSLLVALSPNGLSDGGGYCGLIGRVEN